MSFSENLPLNVTDQDDDDDDDDLQSVIKVRSIFLDGFCFFFFLLTVSIKGLNLKVFRCFHIFVNVLLKY